MSTAADRLRLPFLLLALVAMGLVVLVELGSGLVLGGGSAAGGFAEQAGRLEGVDPPSGARVEEPSGRAIGYLALVDVILLWTVALMVLSQVVPERVHGRVQGLATLIGSLVLLVVAVVLLVLAFVELLVMVSLLAATPFGTIAYLAIWGFFPTGDAAVLLGLLLFLKLAFCVLLLLAQQRFLQHKGLVLLVATSLVCGLIVSFLHGLVPGILVSITDGVAAIVVAVVAIIWAVVLLIGSIPAVVRALKPG